MSTLRLSNGLELQGFADPGNATRGRCLNIRREAHPAGPGPGAGWPMGKLAFCWKPGAKRQVRDMVCPLCGGRLANTTHRLRTTWWEIPAELADRLAEPARTRRTAIERREMELRTIWGMEYPAPPNQHNDLDYDDPQRVAEREMQRDYFNEASCARTRAQTWATAEFEAGLLTAGPGAMMTTAPTTTTQEVTMTTETASPPRPKGGLHRGPIEPHQAEPFVKKDDRPKPKAQRLSKSARARIEQSAKDAAAGIVARYGGNPFAKVTQAERRAVVETEHRAQKATRSPRKGKVAPGPRANATAHSGQQGAKADRRREGRRTDILKPGELAKKVKRWMANAVGEHTATEISKALGRSSGAIANALEAGVKTGIYKRTSDKPKRYRAV